MNTNGYGVFHCGKHTNLKKTQTKLIACLSMHKIARHGVSTSKFLFCNVKACYPRRLWICHTENLRSPGISVTRASVMRGHNTNYVGSMFEVMSVIFALMSEWKGKHFTTHQKLSIGTGLLLSYIRHTSKTFWFVSMLNLSSAVEYHLNRRACSTPPPRKEMLRTVETRKPAWNALPVLLYT